MRLIIMFDLPTTTNKHLRAYRKWHKFLGKAGFIMMTESVYSRLAINKSVATSVKKLVKENLPPAGDIQLLEITERQFANIDYLVGQPKTKVINCQERYIEL